MSCLALCCKLLVTRSAVLSCLSNIALLIISRVLSPDHPGVLTFLTINMASVALPFLCVLVLPSFVFCVLILLELYLPTSASNGITYGSVRISSPSYHSLDISILGIFLVLYIVAFIATGFSVPTISTVLTLFNLVLCQLSIPNPLSLFRIINFPH